MTWKKRIITIALSSALLALVLVGCRQETSSDDSEEPASDPDDRRRGADRGYSNNSGVHRR